MFSFNSVGGRYQALHRQNLYVTPGIATLFFLAFLALDLWIEPTEDSGFEQENAIGVLLALAQVLPLFFLRKAPWATLMAILVAFVAHSTPDYQLLWNG